MDGLHVEGVSQDEGDVLIVAEVGEPVPAVDALAGDDEAVSEGGDGGEEGVGARRVVAVEADGAGEVEDADPYGLRSRCCRL